jgi:hypothetical protein
MISRTVESALYLFFFTALVLGVLMHLQPELFKGIVITRATRAQITDMDISSPAKVYQDDSTITQAAFDSLINDNVSAVVEIASYFLLAKFIQPPDSLSCIQSPC